MHRIAIALVSTTCLSFGFAQVASAADMPVKALKAPPAVVTWTGCFIGGNVGTLRARYDWANGSPAFGPVGTPDVRNTPTGSVVGGQAGCDYQTGQWVLGIQGDYDSARARGRDVAFATSTFGAGTQLESRMRNLASVTGRVGYAWDRFLGYVRGGGAWTRNEFAQFSPAGVFIDTASDRRGGWTVGVGGEYAFTSNVSAFIEYDHYDFRSRTVPFFLVATGAFTFNEIIRQRVDVVKGGINFRWAGGPVRAAY